MSKKIKIYGQLESGLVNGFVTNKDQVEGLSSSLLQLDNSDIKTFSYDENTGLVLTKKDGSILTCDISDLKNQLSRDGMLDDVSIVTAPEGGISHDGNVYPAGTTLIKFLWNTAAGSKVDYLRTDDIGKVYTGSSSINIDSTTNAISVSNVKATLATIENPITIAGGPLADDSADNWPEEWVDANDSSIKVIPAGTSLETIISKLFARTVYGEVSWGAISWSPTMKNPTVDLSNESTKNPSSVEVGTTITIDAKTTSGVNNNTRSCTLTVTPSTNGYFEGDTWSNATKTVSISGNTPTGNLTVTNSLKIGNATGTISNNTFIAGEGTNTITVTQRGYTVTSNKLSSVTVYASTNTKQKLTDASKNLVATLNDTASTTHTPTATTATKSVTGYRYMFWGADTVDNSGNYPTLNSAYIRANKLGTAAHAASTKTMDVSNVTRLWVAVPSSRTVTNIYGANGEQMGSYMGDVVEGTVSVNGVNNFTAATYKLYTFTSGAPLTETITIKIS